MITPHSLQSAPTAILVDMDFSRNTTMVFSQNTMVV